MRNLYRGFLTVNLLLLAGQVLGQQAESKTLTSAVHEFFLLKSTDGRSHEIEAIASGWSGDAKVLYVVEGIQDMRPKGSISPVDGEYLLWKLDANGKVSYKKFISKMPNREPPCVTIIPLRKPLGGVVVIGMFEDRFGWSLLRIDAAGEILKSVKLINEPGAFMDAVLLTDAKSLLLAGQRRFNGSVWKVDLDGETAWEKTYDHKAKDSKEKADDKKSKVGGRWLAQLHGITLTDDERSFMVTGDLGKTGMSGMGQKLIWLMRCGEVGNILAKMTFSGRLPSICTLGKDRFAILYDAGATFQLDSRVRVVDLGLKQKWEKKLQLNAMMNDRPAIASIPIHHGFVVAGCNRIITNKNIRQECGFFQFDTDGQIVSSASIPIAQQTFLHTRVVCETDRAYVAAQTKGLGPFDAKEATIFVIQLRNQDH